MNKQDIIKVSEQELYDSLVDECRSIITERVFRSRLEIILAHGEVGHAIVNNALYKKYGKQNKEFLGCLAQGIGISYSETCRSIQFWNKYKIDSPTSESWKKFKEGKNLSWAGIKQNYLPEPGGKKIEFHPKFKAGQEISVNFSGAIIAVKATSERVLYRVEFESGGKKDDIWVPEGLAQEKK